MTSPKELLYCVVYFEPSLPHQWLKAYGKIFLVGTIMHIAESGLNRQVLDAVGHAPIEYGRYYNSVAAFGEIQYKLRSWLCPVAEWIFGYYPETIWVKIVNI